MDDRGGRRLLGGLALRRGGGPTAPAAPAIAAANGPRHNDGGSRPHDCDLPRDPLAEAAVPARALDARRRAGPSRFAPRSPASSWHDVRPVGGRARFLVRRAAGPAARCRSRWRTCSSAVPPDTSRVTFTQPLDWVAPNGTVSLHERRTITAFADPKIDAPKTRVPGADPNKINVTLLTWRSILSVPGSKAVKLGGSDFSGLGTRFVVSMDGKGQILQLRGPRKQPRRAGTGKAIDNKRVTQSKWCAYTATADNKLVTIAMFHHPKNPQPPYFCHLHIAGRICLPHRRAGRRSEADRGEARRTVGSPLWNCPLGRGGRQGPGGSGVSEMGRVRALRCCLFHSHTK